MIYCADYALSVRTAVEVLKDYAIPQAPINLDLIFKGMNRELAVKTYGQFMKESGLSLKQVIAFFDSELGTCCYDSKSGRYVIYYNASKSDAFVRFTLAHELGHIFLEHHIKAGTDILSRSFIPDAQYEEYEKEANAFARNLLSPAPLAWEVIDEGQSKNQTYDIEFAFDITGSAAGVRVNMIRRDLRDYSPEMKKSIKKIKIRYHKHCNKCHSWIPKESNFCMFCGNSKLSKSLWYKSFPKEIRTDKNGFFGQCPTCGNADLDINSRYCIICATPLKNLCNGHPKSGRSHKRHPNRSFALYCEECGAPTYYNEHNIKIRQEENQVIYNDGVAYDDGTLRVKICPVCKNEQFRDSAEYCIICGTNLYNECEGTEMEGYNGEIYYDNIHRNPSNARFCEICGKPTHFFKKGILVDYKTFQSNAEINGFLTVPDPEPAPVNLSEVIDFSIEIPEPDDELPFN